MVGVHMGGDVAATEVGDPMGTEEPPRRDVNRTDRRDGGRRGAPETTEHKVVYREERPVISECKAIGPANPHLWQGPKGYAAGGRSRAPSRLRGPRSARRPRQVGSG